MTSKVGSLESKFRRETTDPANPQTGDTYYNTANNTLMRFDGAKWSGIAFATSTSTSTTSTSTSTTSTSTSTTSTSSSTSITTSTSSSSSTSTTTTL